MLLSVKMDIAIFHEAFFDAQRSQALWYRSEILLITLSFSIASWDSWRKLGVSYWYSLFPGHWSQNFVPSQIIVYNLRADLGPIPAQKSAIDSFPKFVEVEFSKFCVKIHVFLMKTYPTFSSLSCHFLQIKKSGFHPSLKCAVLLLDIWKSTQEKKKTKKPETKQINQVNLAAIHGFSERIHSRESLH